MSDKMANKDALVQIVGESRGGEADILAEWRERLFDHRTRLKDTPQFLPVKQLAFEVSRQLEKGFVSHNQLVTISHTLSNRALLHRARLLRGRYAGLDEDDLVARFRRRVEKSTQDENGLCSFEAFRAQWEQPFHGAVFTAHPTFHLSRGMRAVLVELILKDESLSQEEAEAMIDGLQHRPDGEITLQNEHEQAQEAVLFAQKASRRLIQVVLEVARYHYPEEWSTLVPKPVELASWVGYDMDGRNDIRWYDSIRVRLYEKNLQIERSRAWIKEVCDKVCGGSATEVLSQLGGLFEEEHELLARQIELFGRDLEDTALLSLAANTLTENKDKGLGGDLSRVLPLLDEAVAVAADDDERMQLSKLRACIRAHGLGTARMHFRVNAAQLNTVARGVLKLAGNVDLNSRVLLKKLDNLIAETRVEDINFASLALERATAIRQFLVIAQILKHIDGTAPIRLLIAECETPFTVLSGVYLARRYGVGDMVDISPLFETEEALDHGARIISNLLKTDSYRQLIEGRGRLCVQVGYSDAGRFIGQIPAALAIERFQAQLAEIVANETLARPVDVLIFDTHGESMGRGAHPASLKDRYQYLLSPWVRWRYRELGLTLQHEVSFQGGDGYVLFGAEPLALAALVEMLEAGEEGVEEAAGDQFYRDTDFSLDYFESIKDYQTSLFQKPDYHNAMGALGTGLLMKTGSRKSKRQFEAGHDNRMAIGEMRAIPHNAILQQMGYLLNIVSGVGEAVQHEHDRFIDMYNSSDRLRRLMEMVRIARKLSSVKLLASYASLFDDAFWVTRPLNRDERILKDSCIELADLLRGDPRHDGIMHLATYVREDAMRLHAIFEDVGLKPVRETGEWTAEQEDWRADMDILHAIRIALIQHTYLLAARIPEFSFAHDITRGRVIGLIISLQIREAVALLRDVYPVSMPHPSQYDMVEQASDLSHQGESYAPIQRDLIDKIEETYELILEIGTGIAHNYAAHG